MEKIIQILKKTSSWLSLGLAGIFGVLIISIISVGYQNTEIEQNFGAFPGIFGMFFLYWMFIWIHEAGHAVAVKLCSHNLHVLRNGRFGFTFAPFKFKYFGPIVEGDYGGYVVYSPKRNEWSQVKDIIIAAAGSLGTLIVGLIAFALSFLFIDYSTLVSLLGATDPKYDQIHHAVSPIGCLLFSCFLIGIVDPLCNWIPRQLSLGGNDGATILSRLKKMILSLQGRFTKSHHGHKREILSKSSRILHGAELNRIILLKLSIITIRISANIQHNYTINI